MQTVNCTVLGHEAPALAEAPYPGPIGQRILETVSAEGWGKWLERQVLIINENQLSSAAPQAVELLEQHMLGFLFIEGDLGGLPSGFAPSKK
ncbi:MAG: oxidative damage protection protein [Arenicellales bacterium]